jgi:hypothetical protein
MRILIALLLTMFLCVGLATAAAPVGLTVNRLADADSNQCPVCKRAIIPGHIRDDAVDVVSTEIGGYLAEKGFTVTQDKNAPRAVNVLIYRFRERQGGNFAVEKAASAAFHVHLMRGNDVERVFVFDETQQPLSSNVLDVSTFVKRGAKWITVGELAREGIHKAVDSFADNLNQVQIK